MSDELAKHYLETVILEFRSRKKLAERALDQLTEAEFFITIDPESNGIAVIIKHIAGNMRSRWMDFLTSDGEKPDRFRDQEFIVDANTTRDQVMQWWEQGWQYLFTALEPLQPADVMRTVVIRQDPHTVVQAISRQLAHYSEHIGQILFLAKHLKGCDWKTPSIPRGQSEQFNQKMIELRKNSNAPRVMAGDVSKV
jgi:hypothetical protein